MTDMEYEVLLPTEHDEALKWFVLIDGLGMRHKNGIGCTWETDEAQRHTLRDALLSTHDRHGDRLVPIVGMRHFHEAEIQIIRRDFPLLNAENFSDDQSIIVPASPTDCYASVTLDQLAGDSSSDLTGHSGKLYLKTELDSRGSLPPRVEAAPGRPVTQPWTHNLPMMQQTVLLTAIRGPDGVEKYHPTKDLIRWYRRCVLYGALDHNIFTDPVDPRGGSFTGPSLRLFENYEDYRRGLQGNPTVVKHRWLQGMAAVIGQYLKSLDSLPHHFQLHFMHAAEIVGYKHPESDMRVWWNSLYRTLVEDMHLRPETEEQMDFRLSDNEDQWRATSHEATQD